MMTMHTLRSPLTLTVAVLALLALPTAVQAGATASDPIITVPLFEQAPIEQAKPLKCGPGEEEFGTTYEFFIGDADDCAVTCTGFCQDGGGYLLNSTFNTRGLFCTCRCCRPR